MGGDANATVLEGVTLGQYVARLAAAACIPGNARAYAKQIREFADRRKILATAETMSIGIQSNQPAADIAGAGIELLDEIATRASAGATPQVSLREANDKSLARMQYGMQNPGKLAGMSWGLAGLDSKTGGLKRGEMFVMAGRPGMGKTALAWRASRPIFGRPLGTLAGCPDGIVSTWMQRSTPCPNGKNDLRPAANRLLIC